MNEIVQMISSVGFPIVMCVIMLKYAYDLNTQHKEEIEKFTDALNNNTLALQKLCDKMGVDRE